MTFSQSFKTIDPFTKSGLGFSSMGVQNHPQKDYVFDFTKLKPIGFRVLPHIVNSKMSKCYLQMGPHSNSPTKLLGIYPHGFASGPQTKENLYPRCSKGSIFQMV